MLTSIIDATVRPRMASSEVRRAESGGMMEGNHPRISEGEPEAGASGDRFGKG